VSSDEYRQPAFFSSKSRVCKVVPEGNLLNEFSERKPSCIYVWYILILIAPEGTWAKFSLRERSFEVGRKHFVLSFFLK
jgi:hypothetical protein